MVLPGWGQLAADRPVLGWALIGASLCLGAFAVGAALRLGAVELAAWALQPHVLAGILVGNVAMAIGRLAVSTHAWRMRGGRGWAAAAFLGVVVLAPHVVVGWAGWITRDTLQSVFAGPPPAVDGSLPAGTTTTTNSPTSTGVTTTTTTTTNIPTTTSTAPATSTTTTTVPTTTTTAPPTTTTTVPFEGERLNLLILGGDAGPGRPGLRTDTMLVGSVDPATGDAALFGLPRNYGGITFSDGSDFPGDILNEVYGFGVDHPERFDGLDPGAAAVMDVAEMLTGLHIDHFMLVDMTGFGSVVDAFGGVTLDVPESVYGPLYDPETGGYEMIRIETGRQTLTGDQALAYSRARLGSSDYARMARQRCLLTAMVDGIDPVGVLAGLPGLLDTLEANLTTDLPLDLVPDLIRLAGTVSGTDVRVVGFGPDWSLGRNGDGYHVPDVDRIRETVRRTITDPEAAADLGVAAASETCG